jgi:hypothetical protein
MKTIPSPAAVISFFAGRNRGAKEARGPISCVTTPSGKIAEEDVPAESLNIAVVTPPQSAFVPLLRTVTASGRKASSTRLAFCPPQ